MSTVPDVARFVLPFAARSAPLTAGEMAMLVDEHASALWRGEEAADSPFYLWLSTCLHTAHGQEPPHGPVAISRLAAGGAGIRWYESPTEIVGYVPGVMNAHYVIPRHAFPTWIRAEF